MTAERTSDGPAIGSASRPGRYEARIRPEAWVRDNAIPVDAPGPDTWDCTAYALKHPDYLARMIAESAGSIEDGVTDNDDMFKGDPAAPGLGARLAWPGHHHRTGS